MFPLHEPIDGQLRAELSSHDDFTAALLARRGITSADDAAAFLSPSYDTHVHDPLLITDMDRAARRLADAILNGERIAAWTDYDCDGIPAAVILHDFFSKVGADFENYIPHRHTEGYGVSEHGIEQLAARGRKLIVTADSGITDNNAVERANQLGMEVIVTDHHLPGKELPKAFAVVNPNARESETAPYRSYCGAALAWKLVCATLAVEPKLRERVGNGWEKWLLDMAGLATIADMVPLVGENRVIATYGITVLRKSPRIGLQKLCRVMGVNQRFISEDDIGFMLAPRVNAASRMGDAIDAFTLFTTKDEAQAELLAKKLEKLNRERKAQAGAITRAARAKLAGREIGPVVVLGDPDWRPSLLGLVANGIAEEYDRPVFLWGREGNNSLKGSCRSPGSINLVELMTAANEVLVEFGGHAASGGFTVKDDRVFDLENTLCAAVSQVNTSDVDDLLLRADAVMDPADATVAFLRKLERMAPFGEGNPKPVFLLRDIPITSVSRFGKSEEHLKLQIERPFEGPLEGIAFFAKGKLAQAALALPAGKSAHLLAHLERNMFSRTSPVRLRLLGIVPA